MEEINVMQKRGDQRSSARLAVCRAVAAALCGLAAGVAQAQTYAVPEQDAMPDTEADVIKLIGSLQVTHDDNLLRVNDGARNGRYADRSLGDTFLQASMGIEFDRLLSQQRLRANATVNGFKYNEYDDFDNIGYDAGATLDWVIGRPFFGSVGFTANRRQPTVQDRLYNATTNVSGDRNDVDSQLLFFNAGFRMTPAWSLIAGVDMNRSRNSLEVYKDTDYDLKSAEGGVRYAPGTGIELDFVYRTTDGDYKSPQRYDDNGAQLLCGTNCRENDYSEDSFLTRIQYRPSEDSRLAGNVGYTRRDYDQGNRNFRGLTTGFDVEWALSGNVQMRVALARSIEPDDDAATSSQADTRSIDISPLVQVTGKISVAPFIRYYDRKYEGEQLAAGLDERKDKITMFGAQATYEFRRNMAVLLSLQHDKRDSNRDNLDYTANVYGLGLRVQF